MQNADCHAIVQMHVPSGTGSPGEIGWRTHCPSVCGQHFRDQVWELHLPNYRLTPSDHLHGQSEIWEGWQGASGVAAGLLRSAVLRAPWNGKVRRLYTSFAVVWGVAEVQLSKGPCHAHAVQCDYQWLQRVGEPCAARLMCPRAGTWALRCAHDPQLHMLVSCDTITTMPVVDWFHEKGQVTSK